MGENLWDKYLTWLKDEEGVESIVEFLTEHGVSGLLCSFEEWLTERDYLVLSNGQYVKGRR